MDHPLREAGFTLLEVLVAFAVLTLGLLGIVTMMMLSLETAASARHRLVAASVANDLAERMRANIPGIDGNAYVTDSASDCTTPPAFRCAMTPGHGADGIDLCSATQMAIWDLYEVSCVHGIAGNHGGLPDGRLAVACEDADPGDGDPCSDGSTHVIRVDWLDRRDEQRQQVVTAIVPGPRRE